jgi:Bacterial transglutaminase-like N-terminal region
MPSLTIRHVTTYRYRQPVAFGEHRMMLRPRDAHDQRVIEAGLEISPEPRSLRFVQDAFGNHVGIARFSSRSKELCFESTMCLEHSPLDAADLEIEDAARTFPVDYSADEMPDRAYCIERHQPDPGNEIGGWAHQFLPPLALSSFSPGSQGASIAASSTGGGKRRESSSRWRRSGSAMAAAAILPC